MDEQASLQYKTRSQELRADLKRWESDWAQTHQGNKPSREDIKSNPEIARKYKEYNNVRDILAGKKPLPQPPKPDREHSKKRSSGELPSTTPPKRIRHNETPRKNDLCQQELTSTPSTARKLFSPQSVTSIGPTPQRDGRVLGIFDVLLDEEVETPSKPNAGAQSQSHILRTPSRRNGTSYSKLVHTPRSTTKRYPLREMSTPVHNRLSMAFCKSPTSASKGLFDTPAFLKRHSLPTVDEDAVLSDSIPLKLPKKPLMRGLSEIIAGLRKAEDERLDDDLDALRDMENEELGKDMLNPTTQPSQLGKTTDYGSGGVDERPRLPLDGFDDEAMYDSPVEDGVNRDGSRMAVYKKKGQKRTTRRSKMKPVQHERPAGEGNEMDQEESETLDTNRVDAQRAQGSQVDLDGEYEEEKKGKANVSGKKEGPIKKTLRKVNELAHANFHRLKLRNRGAKGGPGHNSKFRRRR